MRTGKKQDLLVRLLEVTRTAYLEANGGCELAVSADKENSPTAFAGGDGGGAELLGLGEHSSARKQKDRKSMSGNKGPPTAAERIDMQSWASSTLR